MSGSRRLLAAVILVGALVAAGVVDSRTDADPPEAAGGPQMPVAASASARSSVFFCTGATARSEGAANGTVVIANAGDRAVRGTITASPSEGERASAPVEVPPAARVDVTLTDLVSAPYASAMVVLDGGDAVVELVTSGPLGTAITPCASAASQEWYFAEGVTTRDASEVLSLFNPFPEDALVDLSFMTEEGEVTPEDLTGLTVPGQDMVAVDLADYVQRRQEVSSTVEVRTGRLVVARLQSFDGTNGRKGVSLALGAPSPGLSWYFPDGIAGDGVTERFQLFNPSSSEASVEITLGLQEGTAEPILLVVPPQSRLSVVANDEARIPKDQPHTAIVEEVSGVGIVAERSIDAAAPSSRQGSAYVLGARIAARQWVAAAGQVSDTVQEELVVLNPTAAPARVSVALLDGGSPAPVATLQDVEVAAGGRWAVVVNEAVRRAGPVPLLVTADRDIVVEYGVHRTGALGTARTMAVPLRDDEGA